MRLFALKRQSFVSSPDWILHSHTARIPLLTAQVICDCRINRMVCVYSTQFAHPVQSSGRRERILTQLLRNLADQIQACSVRNKSFRPDFLLTESCFLYPQHSACSNGCKHYLTRCISWSDICGSSIVETL